MALAQKVARRDRVRKDLLAPRTPREPGRIARAIGRLRAAFVDPVRACDPVGRGRALLSRSANPVRAVALLVAGPLLGWHFLFGSEGWVAQRGLRGEIEGREREVASLEVGIEDLRDEVRRLRDDPI